MAIDHIIYLINEVIIILTTVEKIRLLGGARRIVRKKETPIKDMEAVAY